jgi:hypothetical protein
MLFPRLITAVAVGVAGGCIDHRLRMTWRPGYRPHAMSLRTQNPERPAPRGRRHTRRAVQSDLSNTAAARSSVSSPGAPATGPRFSARVEKHCRPARLMTMSPCGPQRHYVTPAAGCSTISIWSRRFSKSMKASRGATTPISPNSTSYT